ncbi:MAG TPA: GNAT family N-acetyltransferase [Solirubrobacterales bacterium]|nr:GNAT family N-acetyltransferase [Solirubrobacterales bacterium]
MTYTRPEPLRGKHDLGDFSCGDEALDGWLHRRARHAEAARSARTFVTTSDGQVAGYYTLTVGEMKAEQATERLLKGQPKGRPVPILVLARLAVDRNHQGRGVGWSLLQDALLRCSVVAESVGVRAVVAHAKEGASSFYDKFNFECSPSDPLHRILLMKDLESLIGEKEG